MNLPLGLMMIALAGATPCAAQDAVVTDEEQALFDLALQRKNERRGTPAAETAVVPAPVVVGAPAKPPPTFEEGERERAKEFNGKFGDGAYERIVGFSERCKSADGCNKFAATGLLRGGYDFVALRKDVDNKIIAPESPAYLDRNAKIKDDLKTTMNDFRPQSGVPTSYARDFIQVSDPIVKVIFTPQELVRYAERNASTSDSAPFYTYLGQALNAAGPPGQAQAAFDAALKRDPKSDAALSGRAESRLIQGDYPGAVRDAVAALKINPRNDRAYATLKFSEGRVPAEIAGGGSGAFDRPAAPDPGGAVAAGFGPGGGGASLAAAGPSAFEALRRSDALVSDARRSLSVGDTTAAIALLSKAVEANPRNAVALALSAMAHIRARNFPDALAAAEAGLKLAPDSVPLLDAKANALNYMKDYAGALAAADLAIAANPRDAMAHYNRAWALGGLRDREGALSSLRAAAGLNPQFAPALDAAMSLPLESDILFLFPGGKEEAQTEPEAPAPPSGRPAWLPMAGAAAAALLLILGARLRRAPEPAAAPAPRKAPELLDGKFEVGREIGAGGMGVVYLGRDRSLDRVVAIKRMREEIRWDPKERARFISEAKLVARVKHPHIVEIHAIVEQDGEVYLIFEHVAGRTLQEVIAQETKLSFEKARDLFRGVAAALDYAQSHNVIHRDLKPANLMVGADGRIRVMDFGIARLTEEAITRRSRTNAAVGTPLYMAPEQEQGVMRKESDAYSMALCLYETLTGRRPFAGTGAGLLMNKLKSVYEPPSRHDARLPPGIDEVFQKALDPDPDKRYSTAGNFLRALEGLETPRA